MFFSLPSKYMWAWCSNFNRVVPQIEAPPYTCRHISPGSHVFVDLPIDSKSISLKFSILILTAVKNSQNYIKYFKS